jgi:hypothetical protein
MLDTVNFALGWIEIRWTPKIGPEVKLSKWFGGGSNKPN